MVNAPDTDRLAISTITAAKLLQGVHRAAHPEQRHRRLAFVDQVLADMPVLPFDLKMARVQAEIAADLSRRGLPVGAHDLLIAATALAYGYRLATRDQRSFPRIPGLDWVRW